MLRRLTLRDFAIVPALQLDFHPGFSVLTGETGAGKSILIDALQLALGSRADATVVREGAARAEVSAEFDASPALDPWLAEAGFDREDMLLLRRTVDAQGKSRAWINGSPATVAQLREAADALVDIHGQHAWQSLTRPAAARALLDAQAGVDATDVQQAFQSRKGAADVLATALERQDELARERDRLAWQIGEMAKLAPNEDEWPALSAEHQRLTHGQSLIDASRQCLQWLAEAEDQDAERLVNRALEALTDVVAHDASLQPVIDALNGALAQLRDASHVLNSYLGRAELDPDRLAELDARMAAWLGMARRWRRKPEELPALLAQWRQELASLEAAADTATLESALALADRRYREAAAKLTQARSAAAEPFATEVSNVMQQLGMAGGRFEIQLSSLAEPQAHGLESVEFLVAGHAGSSPRPLAKVASGGELSRLALAIAVTTLRSGSSAGTLIFDEIDAGIGGAVGDTVGALMKQLGAHRQVLAVTHLAQVAACADLHYVVAKGLQADGRSASTVGAVQGEARVAEVARMLGGERMADTSLAHAHAMLHAPASASASAPVLASRSSPMPLTTGPTPPTPAPPPSRKRSRA